MTRHPRSRVAGVQIARLSADGERLCRAPTADHIRRFSDLLADLGR